MNIYPVDRFWIHTYVLEPYAQGCELINRAWNGIGSSLEQNRLSLRDRIVCWIQGITLMLPLLNTIIWLAWQTFGQPEKLADPFCPETTSPPPLFIPPLNHIIRRPSNEGKVEQFAFIETTNAHPICAQWTIETFPDNSILIAMLNATEFSSSAIYNSH